MFSLIPLDNWMNEYSPYRFENIHTTRRILVNWNSLKRGYQKSSKKKNSVNPISPSTCFRCLTGYMEKAVVYFDLRWLLDTIIYSWILRMSQCDFFLLSRDTLSWWFHRWFKVKNDAQCFHHFLFCFISLCWGFYSTVKNGPS